MRGAVLHRLAHWLWWRRHPLARLARAALLPAALVYAAAMRARAAAYRHGWLRSRRLPLPAVAVGNLAVGGVGKTPLAAWIAAWYAARGVRPGILLRDYGRDESRVHARLVPDAVVVPDPDRVAGAERARAAGARVVVLDDAYQHLRVARDVNVLVIGAERAAAVPWSLPAGPWREGWGALGRATVAVVTRRRAGAAEASKLAERLRARRPGLPVAVAHLAIDHLEGMRSGARTELAALARARVVVAAGIGDPTSFAVQVRGSGARVQLVAYQDHHTYGPRDVAGLVQAAGEADYVVVTEKDAVKLRPRWPAEAPEPLVAVPAIRWEHNLEDVERALAAVLPDP